MSEKDTAKNPHDPCVEKAVRLVKPTHELMVTKAMRAVGFSSKDVDDRSKRMWIHRRLKKKVDTKPSSITVQSVAEVSSVSLSENY